MATPQSAIAHPFGGCELRKGLVGLAVQNECSIARPASNFFCRRRRRRSGSELSRASTISFLVLVPGVAKNRGEGNEDGDAEDARFPC